MKQALRKKEVQEEIQACISNCKDSSFSEVKYPSLRKELQNKKSMEKENVRRD